MLSSTPAVTISPGRAVTADKIKRACVLVAALSENAVNNKTKPGDRTSRMPE
jgi:hypothetical protein